MSEYIHLPSRIFAILNATVNGPIMAIIAKSARLNSLHIYHQYSQLSTRYRQMDIGCGYHGSAIYRLCCGILGSRGTPLHNPSRSEESPTKTYLKSGSDDDDDDDDDHDDHHHPSFWTFSTLNALNIIQKCQNISSCHDGYLRF